MGQDHFKATIPDSAGALTALDQSAPEGPPFIAGPTISPLPADGLLSLSLLGHVDDEARDTRRRWTDRIRNGDDLHVQVRR